VRFINALGAFGFIALLSACDVAPIQTGPIPSDTPRTTQESNPRLNASAAARSFVQVVRTLEPVAERECRNRTTGLNCDFNIVVDDRPDYANRERFPEANRVICGDFAEVLREFPIDANTYIVTVTRGHKHDEVSLRQVAESAAAYVGMIGSKRRVSAVLQHLIDEGLDAEAVYVFELSSGEWHTPGNFGALAVYGNGTNDYRDAVEGKCGLVIACDSDSPYVAEGQTLACETQTGALGQNTDAALTDRYPPSTWVTCDVQTDADGYTNAVAKAELPQCKDRAVPMAIINSFPPQGQSADIDIWGLNKDLVLHPTTGPEGGLAVGVGYDAGEGRKSEVAVVQA